MAKSKCGTCVFWVRNGAGLPVVGQPADGLCRRALPWLAVLEPVLPEGGRRRRTRLENKAARVWGERRRQRLRMHLRMKKKARRRTFDGGGDPPPF